MNIGTATDGYERGVCALYACLTYKDKVATQPCEVAQRIFPHELVLLLFGREEGAAPVARGAAYGGEGARRVRNNVDAFRLNVIEEI